MRHLIVAGLLSVCAACQAEPASAPEPECSLNAFRACVADGCRGVQQCVEPGRWSACDCTVGDASYADVASEAAADAGSDAATDAAMDATDAAADAEGDAA